MTLRVDAHANENDEMQGKAMKRRGILAAAGAVVAGIVARQVPEESPVMANDGTWTFPYFGTTSYGAAAFNITNTSGSGISGTSSNASGVYGSSSTGHGVYGISTGNDGIAGYFTGTGGSNAGVIGYGNGSDTYGVFGNGNGGTGIGVEGFNYSVGGTGVKGIATNGFPIIGQVTGIGSDSNTAAGVLGSGTKGPGVQGQSASGHGLVGTTDDTAGHAGLVGNANNAGGIGLMGIAPGYGTTTVGKAGVFYGNVQIIGGALSAPMHTSMAKHQGDGSYRLLQSMASPEGWVEDFGEASFTNNSAQITLDHDFAALIEPSGYQVYLTEYDDHHSLYVTNRSASGFVVQAKETVTASGVKAPTKGMSGRFGYRVVGRRKDVSGERLAKVAAPSAPNRPAAFTIPETPAVKLPTTKP